MVETEAIILTDRQVEVLELRQRDNTQREVAEMLGTTDSNVSAVERAAESNIEKARRTLEFVRTLRAPVQFTVPSGLSFDEVVDTVYSQGDEAGVKISYCRPEMYTHLFGKLESHMSQGTLETSVTVGLTKDGDVKVFADPP